MTSAQLFVRCLEQEGVQFVFGLPGEENLGLLDALADSPIRFIQVRHEQAAAFMADVYGRLTGRPGVCLSTLGPGATNLVTGVADAYLDHAPVVAITAQTSLEKIHKESHQSLDVVGIFRRMTKFNAQVPLPSVIPEIVRKAFRVAQAEKPGPCHIELPEDIAGAQAKGVPLPADAPARYPHPDPQTLQAAAAEIASARHPVLLAGNGVIRGGASDALRQLARASGIAVANTFMGKGVLSWDDPLSMQTLGLQTEDSLSHFFAQADLVIAVGYDVEEFAPCHWNPDGTKQVIHIDFTPAEVDSHYRLAVEIVADIRKTLESLTSLVGASRPAPADWRARIMQELTVGQEDDSFPMKPQRVLKELHSVLSPNDLILSDVGAHKFWIARNYLACNPNTVIISNGFASMGIALPGAIAAKLIYPERRVVAVCGDGGFLMNSQELETAVRLKVNPIIILFRDGAYGSIRFKQMDQFGRTLGVQFGNPNFSDLAAAYGAASYEIDSAQAFLPCLKSALTQDRPVLIDVPVDYSQLAKVIKQVKAA